MTHAEHKQLMTQRRAVQQRLAAVRCDILNAGVLEKKLASELQSIETRIEQAGNLRLVVSEHALLRYLERCYGVDLESVSERIRIDLELVGAGFDGRYSLGHYSATVRDGVVVTVME